MDNPGLPSEELSIVLDDINRVNRLLGGFKFSLQAIKKAIHTLPKQENVTILDLGCGEGSLLRYLDKHLKPANVQLIGVDLNPQSIALAKQSTRSERISYICADIRQIDTDRINCDILTCMLTLHHLSDAEIRGLLQAVKPVVRHKIIINDLHRHILAYLSFKLVSPILLKHPISRYDGLVSIASGFKTKELNQYATECGFVDHRIDWKWSFRYIWTIDL